MGHHLPSPLCFFQDLLTNICLLSVSIKKTVSEYITKTPSKDNSFIMDTVVI